MKCRKKAKIDGAGSKNASKARDRSRSQSRDRKADKNSVVGGIARGNRRVLCMRVNFSSTSLGWICNFVSFLLAVMKMFLQTSCPSPSVKG